MHRATNTGYAYEGSEALDEAKNLRDAIRITVFNYMQHQLGWSREACKARVEQEVRRDIPKYVFNWLEGEREWQLEKARLLDVGAGQGAGVQEALSRGINAYGIEPGREFRTLARMRLEEAGYDKSRIQEAPGEAIPFPNNHFDYVISLQVLEHVPDPLPVLEEIFRVLRPGGQCFISCENYLAFREQHYRVAWLPLLPKSVGDLYLRLRGRDPYFLREYVYYTTYPQVWRAAREAGFENKTFQPYMEKFREPQLVTRSWLRPLIRAVGVLPDGVLRLFLHTFKHAINLFSVGTQFILSKPAHL